MSFENNSEIQHPFRGELNSIKQDPDFSLHNLGTPDKTSDVLETEQKEFSDSQNIITEYFNAEGRNHQSFVELKRFYESMQAQLENLLPKTFFVEGMPSDTTQAGRSFYVIQHFENQNDSSYKKINELNSNEFSQELIEKLLAIQEKILAFLQDNNIDFPEGWEDFETIDPKTFKEDIVYSPKNNQIQISNLFKLDPDTIKAILGKPGKFEASQDRLKMLKALGLGALVKKISWFLERSALPEWLKGERIHWKLNPEKLHDIEQAGQKAMSLTFDDGPNEETEELLDILKEKNIKATFFLVGSQIPARENIVKRIVDEGHEIGVHEWSQEGLPTPEAMKNPREYAKRFIGPRQDLGDVKKTKDLITKVSGQEPKLSRMAGVHATVDSLREFQAMNLDIIHADPYDVLFIPPSKKIDSKKLLSRALKNNGHGKIRLFHIGAMTDQGIPLSKDEVDIENGEVYPPEQTLKMIKRYIEDSQRQGYQFVGIKEYI
ncbi:polysaccharide deacetylase family protein [Patescibacteria group bacterium]|nr:polysaccharide deacetylase family protein [Patescibacteria group bacterium]